MNKTSLWGGWMGAALAAGGMKLLTWCSLFRADLPGWGAGLVGSGEVWAEAVATAVAGGQQEGWW